MNDSCHPQLIRLTLGARIAFQLHYTVMRRQPTQHSVFNGLIPAYHFLDYQFFLIRQTEAKSLQLIFLYSSPQLTSRQK